MRFATVVLTATNLRVVTMHSHKDNQRETMTIEIVAWVLVLGIVYILAKTIF